MQSSHLRESLALLPTPLERSDRLTEAWQGPTIWIKRDDLTGFGLSGNKVRKLEYHFGAARHAGATTVVTCGAVQSNHCRATALAAARLGFDCILLLRSRDGQAPDAVTGNHLLQRLAGATVRFLTPAQYRDERDELMAAEASAHASAWVIPEGASDELGLWSFDAAMHELAEQWSATDVASPPTIWHAASSGGTSAGMAVGVKRSGLDAPIVGSSVGDTAAHLWDTIYRIVGQAGLGPDDLAPMELLDNYIGGGYGRTTDDELAIQVEASRLTGLIWDPTYTGKAVVALRKEIDRGRFGAGDHVVLWHTGGGFAAFAHDFGSVL